MIFASVALGMGMDLRGVNTIIHYGVPSSIEDYIQASGRGGRSGKSSQLIVYWRPSDCPMTKEPSTPHHREVNDIRRYLENSSVCRRKWLLEYFDPDSAQCGDDPVMCVTVHYHLLLSHQPQLLYVTVCEMSPPLSPLKYMCQDFGNAPDKCTLHYFFSCAFSVHAIFFPTILL